MRDHDIWRSELINEIRTIANPNELKRLWSGADSHLISSFAEEVAHVFDDYDIDGFIASGQYKAKLDLEQFVALQKFRDLFAEFVNKMAPMPLTSIAHETVLADQHWSGVSNAAREFITLLDDREDSKVKCNTLDFSG
jgi:hypothetical protein